MSLWETFQLEHESKALYRRSRKPNSRSQLISENKCSPLPLPYDGSSKQTKYVKQWGTRLARKKMIQRCSATKEDCYSDGTRVIYRQREDWSRQQGYSACTFLDPLDTVLAFDRSGCIDVIRLPTLCGATPRKLGTVLVDALDLRMCDHTPITPKLKSLKGGQSFVVACGESLHVFASERVRSWGDDRHLEKSYFSEISPSAFLAASWTLHGPRRKYHRDYHNVNLSLANMASTNNRIYRDHHDIHLLREIENWNVGTPKERLSLEDSRFCRRRSVFQSAKWDFYETASSLLAARVDSEQDSFWLQLIDERIHDPVVCVDQASRDVNLRFEEHIMACAFASQTLLATAHLTCPSSRPSSTPISGTSRQGEQRMESCVKLWDIRMISSTRKENELATVHLPQFPYNRISPFSPELVRENLFDDEGLGHFVISTLSSSRDDMGTILLTAQSQNEALVEHYLLNLGNLHCEKINRQKDDQEHLLFSASENHDILACVENQNEILLFDSKNKGLNTHGSKRQIDGSLKSQGSHCQPSACLHVDIKDRHGLETQLSCISMNSTGTSILGGSIDGDLIVWRGV